MKLGITPNSSLADAAESLATKCHLLSADEERRVAGQKTIDMTKQSCRLPTKQSPSEQQLDALVVGILRGKQRQWPFENSLADTTPFLAFAKRHRLSPLLQYCLRAEGDFETWPLSIRDGLSNSTRKVTSFQLARESFAEKLVADCKPHEIEPIFFKGFALARSVYPIQNMRPSVDIDVLIQPSQRARTIRVFESLGFDVHAPYRGSLHSNEVVLRRKIGNTSVEFDCHYAINNRPMMAQLLSYDELRASAQQNGPFLIPSLEHSLLLSCIHRVAHDNTEDLLWLSDFRYTVAAMTDLQKNAFLTLCRSKSVQQICRVSLNTASQTLHCDELASLAGQLDGNASEPTSVYLRESRSAVGDAFVRWSSLATIRMKARYAVELLFPDRGFLDWKFGQHAQFRLIRNAVDLLRVLLRGIQTAWTTDGNAKAFVPNRQGPN